MRLKLQLPSGGAKVVTLAETATLGELAAEVVAAGGPDASSSMLSMASRSGSTTLRGEAGTSLSSLGVSSGTAIRVAAGAVGSGSLVAAPPPPPPSKIEAAAARMQLDEWACTACTLVNPGARTVCAACDTARRLPRLVRRVVPANNSCLFAAVGYVAEPGHRRDAGPRLRAVVADAVRGDPETWNAAVLDGRSADEYAAYITDESRWGGSVELTILAEHTKTQLVALDVVNLNTVFHPDPSACDPAWPRAYLLWDGIHYDPVAKAQHPDAPEADDLTTFTQHDDAALSAARALAKEAHDAKTFTDVHNFALQCLVCGQGLRGQDDALAHAKASGHTNFGEITS